MQTIQNFGKNEVRIISITDLVEHYHNKHKPIKSNDMKVVIAGASGSGKTTLARAIAKHFGWEFKENSAGLIMSEEDKMFMKQKWGYKGDWGQLGVINSSFANRDFALYFQESILRARKRIIKSPGNSIYDRSALDPMVYFLNQCVDNWDQDTSDLFLQSCVRGLEGVDLIIRLQLVNPDRKIEDNGSRIANWFFQQKIDALFDRSLKMAVEINKLHEYMVGDASPQIVGISVWDWESRFGLAQRFVETLIRKKTGLIL